MKKVSCLRVFLFGGTSGIVLLCGQAAKGDFVFGAPTPVTNLNTASADAAPSITADGLELYFASNRDHGADLCFEDIWVTTRATIDEPWGTPKNLGPPVNTSYAEYNPSISADGLELYFSDGWPPLIPRCEVRPGGYGRGDIWVSTRQSRDAPWGLPVNLGPTINSFEYDGTPCISADGLSLYFCSARSVGHGFDLYVATRPTKDDPWGVAVELGPPINTMAQQDYLAYPFLSPDGLCLFFMATGIGAANGDICVSIRATTTDPWGVPTPFVAINSIRHDEGLTFAPGDSTLYFVRCDTYNPNAIDNPALATFDLWQVNVTPDVDLNGDGIVNAADLCILTDYWHSNERACDIAPPPLGDGVVDIQDLSLLAKYLAPGFQCVAHWGLDEVKGTIAYDSVGDNDATVIGDARWYPTEGKIGGALQLDGFDDYVSTGWAMDPKEGPVRVACWIRSDIPGGVIVSQTPGTGFASTWLSTDPTDGTLVTAMMFPFPTLRSRAVVTDGQWHEVAVEWDGTHRSLWVDKREVCRDATPMSVPPLHWNGALNIGVGESYQPDSFFSGLIDDIRIYSRAETP